MKDYKRLDLIMVSEPKGCGYYYLVQKDCTSYTAFRTYKALRLWMDDRGLSAQLIRRSRGHAFLSLHGQFEERVTMNQAEWDAIIPARTVPFLSNGSYTVAKVTENGGTRVLTYLNPNARTRPILDYAATDKALDAGVNPIEHGIPSVHTAERDIILRMVANFPGLYDCETEVNGADLVEWITNEIHAVKEGDGELGYWARYGMPEKE